MYTGRRYGSDLIVDLLKLHGIEYVSLNPGSSFRGLHDSLVNYGGNQPEMIECTHEEVAVAMAHGYAKASGKPMAAILHNVVGLLHSCMAIYYAYLDRAPVLLLGATGPMDIARRRPHIDWIHTASLQGNAIRDYVKWDNQPYSAASVPDSFARGYRLAMTDPKGPVYLCYDAAFQEDELEEDISLPDISRTRPPASMMGAPQAMEEAARMLAEAEAPAILAGYMGRNPQAFHSLVALAETLGAPVVDLNNRLNFPTMHPLKLSGSEVLSRADLILALDVKDLYGPLTTLDRVTRSTEYITQPGCRIIDIGFRDLEISKWSEEYQKLQEVDLSILAETSLALPALTARCRELLSSRASWEQEHQRRMRAAAEEREALQSRWREEARGDWDARPIGTSRLAHEVGEAMKGYDWVLTANTIEDWALRLWDFDRPYRHPGKSLGTATQIGISMGVALAHKGTGRLVVDLQPDGDLLFDVGALWIATHHQIPMLVVMYNNRSYYNDWEHQIRMAQQRGTDESKAYLGMEIDRPAPDFAKLAQAFGWYAEGPIDDPSEVRGALERAIKRVREESQPALVDTVTQFR